MTTARQPSPHISADGRLKFFNDHQALADKTVFNAYLKPLYKTNWAIHAKEPFAGPKAMLAYLSRYTHRVAIANSRLISVDDKTVTFTWKDYRAEGAGRYKAMNLPIHEFIRRFLIHVFPKRFHHIRHYGLLANGNRVNNVALARRLLVAQDHDPRPDAGADKAVEETKTCPACGGRLFEGLTPLAATVPSHSTRSSNPAPNRRPITNVPRPSIGSRRHEHRDDFTSPS